MGQARVRKQKGTYPARTEKPVTNIIAGYCGVFSVTLHRYSDDVEITNHITFPNKHERSRTADAFINYIYGAVVPLLAPVLGFTEEPLTMLWSRLIGNVAVIVRDANGKLTMGTHVSLRKDGSNIAYCTAIQAEIDTLGKEATA